MITSLARKRSFGRKQRRTSLWRESRLHTTIYIALTAVMFVLCYLGPITILIDNETAFVEDEIIADKGESRQY